MTITGAEFYTGSTVTLGGSTCTTPVVVSPTSITCVAPSHAAGAVNVVVTNVDTQTGTGLGVYTYQLAPTVTSITPNNGVIAGGIAVSITGTGFITSATASIGGVNCSLLTVVSSSSITCTTSAHSIGVVTATVTNADLQTGSLAGAFTYRAAPTVTSLSVIVGPLAGGTALVITGTGFYTGPTVTFDGVTCTTPVVVSATSMTCTTPAHIAGAVNVVVTNADTQTGTGTNLYTYQAAPSFGSVLPVSGPLAGLNILTITGTDFISGATVKVGGVTCSLPIVNSSTSIQCTAPAHSAGSVNIVVTNVDTQTGTGIGPYTYQAAPTVTSIAPNAGALAGGTAVTITGTGFLTGAVPSFAGLNCTSVSVVSATSITCITPANSQGAVAVNVTNLDGQIGSAASAFTYRAAPTATSVSANAGTLAGGKTVTVTGAGFYTGSTVTFDGVTCTTPLVINSTSISCITPAHSAGAVDVVVTNADTQTGTGLGVYTYQPAPTINSISPSSGPISGGMQITITGTNFVTGAIFTIAGSPCTTPSVSPSTTMTCSTPAHASGAASAIITNPDGQTGSQSIAYVYIPAPTVTSISLNSGTVSGGKSITITGTGFMAGATITVGGSACTLPVVVNATSMTCTTPSHAAGAVEVAVTNTDLQVGSTASGYTYREAPTIANVSPNGGLLSGGTAATITGTGFYTGSSILFGGTACTGVTVVSSTSITCTTPVHAAGSITVDITNADTQSGTATGVYTYQAAPTLSVISPNTGFATGSTPITISGTGFLTGATVTIGGVSCTGLTVVSPTSITCTTGTHAAGATDVVITNSDTQKVTRVSAYTFNAAPTVMTITPSTGSLAGNSTVSITGTGFTSGTVVTICGSLTLLNSTTLSCTTSAHGPGAVDVVATNTDTQTGTKFSAFTYVSIADLKWQTGATGPTPPNPDLYGSTSTNVTHTYTLKNNGDITTTSITITKTGLTPAAWMYGTDSCSGTTLATGATCTIQVTFLGMYLPAGNYSALLEATAATGGTTSNTISGSVP